MTATDFGSAYLTPDGPGASIQSNIPQYHHVPTGETWVDEWGDEHQVMRRVEDPPIPLGVVFASVSGGSFDGIKVHWKDGTTEVIDMGTFTPNGGDVTVPLEDPR